MDMATLEEVRGEMEKDELDYPALATLYGATALPHLQALVVEDDPRIASKAAYLAGLIAGPTSAEVVTLAAQSGHDVVRVAAAAAFALLPTESALVVAGQLLADGDPGVRARAAKSAVTINHPSLVVKLQAMATQDPEPFVRELALQMISSPP